MAAALQPSSQMVAYGNQVADRVIAGVKVLPASVRVAALRDIMNKLDPKLFGRAQAYANQLRRAGMTAPDALHQGIAAAAIDGMHAELERLGTQALRANQRGALGSFICGMQGSPEAMGGIWSSIKQIGSTLVHLPSTLIGVGGSVGHQAVKVANGVKDLACEIVNASAAPAANVAGSAPSAQSVAIAAGANVASKLCGGNAAPVPASYIAPSPPPTDYTPIMLAAGGAGLLIVVALATRKKK